MRTLWFRCSEHGFDGQRICRGMATKDVQTAGTAGLRRCAGSWPPGRMVSWPLELRSAPTEARSRRPATRLREGASGLAGRRTGRRIGSGIGPPVGEQTSSGCRRERCPRRGTACPAGVACGNSGGLAWGCCNPRCVSRSHRPGAGGRNPPAPCGSNPDHGEGCRREVVGARELPPTTPCLPAQPPCPRLPRRERMASRRATRTASRRATRTASQS